MVEGTLSRIVAFYTWTLRGVLGFPFLTLLVFFATIALTVTLYIKTPKGYFPTDDSGFVIGATRASADISFQAMLNLQQQLADIVMADPAVAGIGSSLGGSGGPGGGGSNRGTMFISLKPPEERGRDVDPARDRPPAPEPLPGAGHPPVHVRGAGRARRRPAERFRLSIHAVEHRSRSVAEMGADRRQADGDGRGHHRHFQRPRSRRAAARLWSIDRKTASSLGVRVQDIDNALNNAFSQRQISIIYTQRNQYMVVLEIDPKFQSRSVQPRAHLSSPAPTARRCRCRRWCAQRAGLSPLAVYHSQSFPSTTVSFNLLPDVPLEVATSNIQRAVDELHMPEGIRGSFDGNAGDFNKTSGRQPLLILGALVAMYIVLGVLYESLAHPLTIISTLPSAGLGALLALQVTNTPLTVIAFVGIILLIGIVKKNGIMMVDFALEAERQRGLSSAEAIFEACSARFRPILMTTMAALFAGIPLAIATGPGTELRRPLGITIIGGLFVSQILTLYTTPVIYLLIDRLRRRSEPCRRFTFPRNSVVELPAQSAYSGPMSEPVETKAGAAEAVADCPHCGKPMPLCICDSVTPIENRIPLLILQHPQEQDRALGTARLTARHFKDAVAQDRPVLAEPVQGAGAAGRRSLALGRALSRFGEGRRPRYRRARSSPSTARASSSTTSAPSSAISRASCCSTAPGARPRRCGGAMPGC